MKKKNSLVFYIIVLFLSSCATRVNFKNDNSIIEDFLKNDFDFLLKKEINKKYKYIILENHNVNINKIAEKSKPYNETDFGITGVSNKRFNLMGVSKNMYFLLHEQGGRIPTRVLLVGYLKNNYCTELLIYELENQEIDIHILKNAIKTGKYSFRNVL